MKNIIFSFLLFFTTPAFSAGSNLQVVKDCTACSHFAISADGLSYVTADYDFETKSNIVNLSLRNTQGWKTKEFTLHLPLSAKISSLQLPNGASKILVTYQDETKATKNLIADFSQTDMSGSIKPVFDISPGELRNIGASEDLSTLYINERTSWACQVGYCTYSLTLLSIEDGRTLKKINYGDSETRPMLKSYSSSLSSRPVTFEMLKESIIEITKLAGLQKVVIPLSSFWKISDRGFEYFVDDESIRYVGSDGYIWEISFKTNIPTRKSKIKALDEIQNVINISWDSNRIHILHGVERKSTFVDQASGKVLFEKDGPASLSSVPYGSEDELEVVYDYSSGDNRIFLKETKTGKTLLSLGSSRMEFGKLGFINYHGDLIKVSGKITRAPRFVIYSTR